MKQTVSAATFYVLRRPTMDELHAPKPGGALAGCRCEARKFETAEEAKVHRKTLNVTWQRARVVRVTTRRLK